MTSTAVDFLNETWLGAAVLFALSALCFGIAAHPVVVADEISGTMGSLYEATGAALGTVARFLRLVP